MTMGAGPPERRAFRFSTPSPGVLEGVLIPYGVPIRIGGAFEEVWEPHCLLLNHIQVNVRHDWRRPFSEFGKGLQTRDGDDAMRAILTFRDTPEARRARSLVEAGALTAFSAEVRVPDEEWAVPDRRIVHQALVTGLALVERPEHEAPAAETVGISGQRTGLEFSRALRYGLGTGDGFTGSMALRSKVMDTQETLAKFARFARTANARGADVSGANMAGVDLSRPGQGAGIAEEDLGAAESPFGSSGSLPVGPNSILPATGSDPNPD